LCLCGRFSRKVQYYLNPGGVRHLEGARALTWDRFFFHPHLDRKEDEARKVAVDELHQELRERQERVCAASAAGALETNPVADFAERLRSPTGSIKLSRIHGDLNLTNVLVCPDARRNPRTVFLIDWAESRPNQPTAVDLARIEAEVWVEAYLGRYLGRAAEEDWLADFVAACRYLNGSGPAPTAFRTDAAFVVGAMSFVYHLRQAACKVLCPSSRRLEEYALEDYFACLYFTYLRTLLWRRYQEVPQRSRLALHGAALALEVMDGLKSGRYSEGGTRRWGSPARVIAELRDFAFPAAGRGHGPSAQSEGRADER
jgi:hypothetical protein